MDTGRLLPYLVNEKSGDLYISYIHHRLAFHERSSNKVVELGGIGNGKEEKNKKGRTKNYFKLAVKTEPVHGMYITSLPVLDIDIFELVHATSKVQKILPIFRCRGYN